MKYVTRNPNHCTLDEVRKAAELIFEKQIECVRKLGYEISGQVGNKVLYEYLGMEFFSDAASKWRLFFGTALLWAL